VFSKKMMNKEETKHLKLKIYQCVYDAAKKNKSEGSTKKSDQINHET
jgi:hypothetical protein